jgi:hypothetical protein
MERRQGKGVEKVATPSDSKRPADTNTLKYKRACTVIDILPSVFEAIH